MILTDELKQELIECAEQSKPYEMCGLLFDRNGVIEFKQYENIADNPYEHFEINSEVWWLEDNIVAVVHSHNNGRNYLSADDIRQMRLCELPYVLVCGNEVSFYRPIEPFIGRPFEFNEMDCYNLFRDCYMLAGIDYPEFTYPPDWYDQGMNLYVDNLQKYGFEKIDGKLQTGDVILFSIRSEIPNHCAVYLKNNVFIHHSIDRLSKRDVLGGYWLKNLHSVWRNEQCKSKLNFTAIYANLDQNLVL